MKNELICVYRNARGEGGVQHIIELQTKKANTNDYHYFIGWSVLQDKVKTLRSDRVLQTFNTAEEAELALSKMDIPLSTHREDYEPKYHISRPDAFDICFTGFKKADKEELTKLAQDNDINICKSITLHLDMLCYGYNAGPIKLRKAMNKGIFIVNREQFENFLETGEIPEDV